MKRPAILLGQAALKLLLIASCGGAVFGLAGWAIAQEPSPSQESANVEPRPDLMPLDLNLLKPGHIPAFAVTATTISQTGLTVPSLWWVWEQYAAHEKFGSKLLENWIAYPIADTRAGRIDLVVNYQLWNLLNYLQRYSFINEFGSTARDYGYNIRVFDNRANFLAAYTCDFSPVTTQAQSHESAQTVTTLPSNNSSVRYSSFIQPAKPLTCVTSLDYNGRTGLRGGFTLPGAGTSTTPGSP